MTGHGFITDPLDRWAVERPDQAALVFGDRGTDYATLKSEVDQLAKALIAAGVARGDRVAMLSSPRPEFWINLLATTSVGAIWVGLNPKYTDGELDHVITDAEPRLVFALSIIADEDQSEKLSGLSLRHPSVQDFIVDEWSGASELALTTDDAALAARRSEIDPSDPCIIVYTSGSTGRPKGAMLTHTSFTMCNEIALERKGLEDRTIICNLPVNHVGCIGDICGRTMTGGGTIHFQESFNPDAMMRTIESEHLNTWGGVPTIFHVCANHPTYRTADLTSVDLLAWGGAAMPADLLESLMEVTECRRATMGYGSTELTGGVTYSDLEDSIENYCTTIGTGDPRQEIRIWHPDGRLAGPGEAGEIQAKGDFVMAGYWRNPEATDAAFVDGWFKTGDLAVRRDDGYLSIVGRLSEMYKSGGYNVYPREVELALEEYAGIGMAAVVSVPDPIYQEVGHAYVMTDGEESVDVDELLVFARDRLANYKVPKKITVAVELPMLAIGKIDKVALHKMARGE
ncbi:MAG: acyl--CoA ligase [Actinomycetia bacterium]|nr:acyl--CoA ligase [Actinomycetes bacterium]